MDRRGISLIICSDLHGLRVMQRQMQRHRGRLFIRSAMQYQSRQTLRDALAPVVAVRRCESNFLVG